MKKFVAVIILAAITGGLIGGELMDRTFSITGATIGGVGLATVLLALGALFTAQEEKKRKALPPEMREVFGRMLGAHQTTGTAKPVVRPAGKPQPKPQQASTEQKAEALFFATASNLLPIQLMPKYLNAREAFGSVVTNKRASGYIFGFHDSLLQRFFLSTPENTKRATVLMEQSYKNLFGEQAGSTLYWMSVNSQEDREFLQGRTMGGHDLANFIDHNVPALGLNRILILGLEA